MKTPSIRIRTTILVVVAVALVWLLAAYFTWREAEHEAAEVFDGHLAQAASMLIAQSAVEIEEPEELDGELHAPLTHRYGRKVAFQVWEHGRSLLVHSENAPNTRLAVNERGFSDSVVNGVAWRVFSGWNTRGDMLVQVGERIDARENMADQMAEGLLQPLAWGLPLLSVLLWLVIGRAMKPLDAVAGEIAARSPDRLEPLGSMAVPREVEPLVRRLDELLLRVAEALQREKRFTGDAAHELRTPIAALCAQAEVALASNRDDERRRALQAVLAAARRSGRLVEQLLTMARADSQLRSRWPKVDLAAVARESIAAIVESGVDHVEFELVNEAPAPMHGEAAWLRVLLRNLLENAARHAPAESVVRVSVEHRGDQVCLSVGDRGPGVAPEMLPRLGERFWRAGDQAGGGSGLGLSIVRRIAELHGTQPEFMTGEEGVGLTVRVCFTTASGAQEAAVEQEARHLPRDTR